MATSMDRAAREAVLLQLADAHDHFSTLEQIATSDRRAVEASGNHQYAVWTLRAYRGELDDREPGEPDACGVCVEKECDGCPMCRMLGRPT